VQRHCHDFSVQPKRASQGSRGSREARICLSPISRLLPRASGRDAHQLAALREQRSGALIRWIPRLADARSSNDQMYLLRDPGRWRQSRPSRRGWRRDARHRGSRRLAAIPARVTDGSSRLEIWCAISAQMVGNLISRQGSHPVSCRTGRSVYRYAWPGPTIIRRPDLPVE
jgi:hypothetical protein